MVKLTKQQLKFHIEAEKILTQDKLSDSDKDFVFTHWNEAATNNISDGGAFFTPKALAADVTYVSATPYGRVIDICAGIGVLAHEAITFRPDDISELVCVEINSKYIEVGKKLVPEARWIHANIFDWRNLQLGRFDVAYSNPPFGNKIRTAQNMQPIRYKGKYAELAIIDIAAEITDGMGAFIVPPNSSPFKYSNARYFERFNSGRGFDFCKETKMHIEPSLDCSAYPKFKNTNIDVEVLTIDFDEWRENNKPTILPKDYKKNNLIPIQGSLF